MDRWHKAKNLTFFYRNIGNHASSVLPVKIYLYIKSYVDKWQKILMGMHKRLPKIAFLVLSIFAKAYLYILSDEKVVIVRDSMECSPRANYAIKCLPRSKPFSLITNIAGGYIFPLASPQEV